MTKTTKRQKLYKHLTEKFESLSDISPAKGWCIVSPVVRPHIVGQSFAWTRKDAIEKEVSTFGPNWTWKKLYRSGWRCIRVEVIPHVG